MAPRPRTAVHVDKVSPELTLLREEVNLRVRNNEPFDNKEPRERITITTTVGGIDYVITTPMLPKNFLATNRYLSKVLERIVWAGNMVELHKKDIEVFLDNILLYYLCHTDIPIPPNELQPVYVFENPNALFGELEDVPGLVEHWMYNHWECFLNFCKLGFWGENMEEPTESRNAEDRRNKGWLMPSRFGSISKELVAIVSPEQYDMIVYMMGRSRSAEPTRSPPPNLPDSPDSDLYQSAPPPPRRARNRPINLSDFGTPPRIRTPSPTRNIPFATIVNPPPNIGPPIRNTNLFQKRKSESQIRWEKTTGLKIIDPPNPASGLNNLVVNPLEPMDTSNPKWKDVQKFDD